MPDHTFYSLVVLLVLVLAAQLTLIWKRHSDRTRIDAVRDATRTAKELGAQLERLAPSGHPIYMRRADGFSSMSRWMDHMRRELAGAVRVPDEESAKPPEPTRTATEKAIADAKADERAALRREHAHRERTWGIPADKAWATAAATDRADFLLPRKLSCAFAVDCDDAPRALHEATCPSCMARLRVRAELERLDRRYEETIKKGAEALADQNALHWLCRLIADARMPEAPMGFLIRERDLVDNPGPHAQRVLALIKRNTVCQTPEAEEEGQPS